VSQTTSHKENETLALATLLNLRSGKKPFATAHLLHGNVDTRSKLDEMMRAFWLVLEENSPGAIPPGIIFLPGDRIKMSGFGWAPITWMSAHRIDYPDPISLISRPAMLAPQNRGLSVEYPGFLLHYHDRNAVVSATDGNGFWFPSDNTLTEWYHAERADGKDYSANKGIIKGNRSMDLAIILCRPRPRQIAEIGLLVEIHATIEQRELGKDDVKRIFAAYILRRITLKRELLESRIRTKRDEILKSHPPEDQSKFICGEVLEEDQRWYVDCRITSVEEDHEQSAQPEPTRTEGPGTRETPFTLRGTTETPVQAESERGTSRAGTEVEVTDNADPNGSLNPATSEAANAQPNSVRLPGAATEKVHIEETEGSEPEQGLRARSSTWFSARSWKAGLRRALTGLEGNQR
jgi:hypothetical protein